MDTDKTKVRTPAPNSTYKKVAVQCSADTFVVNRSLVLRMNICGENRHLRQALNRVLKQKYKDKPRLFPHWELVHP
jgi:hypothetical protein